jgi:hypothetical protein
MVWIQSGDLLMVWIQISKKKILCTRDIPKNLLFLSLLPISLIRPPPLRCTAPTRSDSCSLSPPTIPSPAAPFPFLFPLLARPPRRTLLRASSPARPSRFVASRRRERVRGSYVPGTLAREPAGIAPRHRTPPRTCAWRGWTTQQGGSASETRTPTGAPVMRCVPDCPSAVVCRCFFFFLSLACPMKFRAFSLSTATLPPGGSARRSTAGVGRLRRRNRFGWLVGLVASASPFFLVEMQMLSFHPGISFFSGKA